MDPPLQTARSVMAGGIANNSVKKPHAVHADPREDHGKSCRSSPSPENNGSFQADSVDWQYAPPTSSVPADRLALNFHAGPKLEFSGDQRLAPE